MTSKELIFLARKYNLEQIVRQELDSGLTPDEVKEKLDIC